MKTLITILLVIWVVSTATLAAQPDLKNIAYDDEHASQILDVYLSKAREPAPVMIYIHGGGWRGGSKNRLPAWLAEAYAEGWLAVVSVEYRFTKVATHPAQVNDCARAIQFVRLHAEEWRLDTSRLGVTGGSAGGHLSAYVALHDDEVDLKSSDPVERQSSRVSFAVPFSGPTDWGLLSKIEHTHPAYRQLLGYEPGTSAESMDAALKRDVSPVSFVSSDDPPFLIIHGNADAVVPMEHATSLERALTKAGVPHELFVVEGGKHNVAGAGIGDSPQRATEFMRKYLLPQKAGN